MIIACFPFKIEVYIVAFVNGGQFLICHRNHAYLPSSGGRPGATKVMVVVTDGESHDGSMLKEVIQKCNDNEILRFGIAVSGFCLDISGG